MDKEVYELIDDVTLNKIDDKTFAVSYNGKIFYVGHLLFAIAELLKLKKSVDFIEEQIKERFNLDLSAEKLEEVIADFKANLLLTSKASSTLYTYIYGRLKILNAKTLENITRYFTFLFNKWLVFLLFTAAFLFSFYFLGHVFTTGLLFHNLSIGTSLQYVCINYLFVIIVGLFHEIGHSSASARYGIKSKEVGFGFYLVFPVFYTDISRIWLLDRKKRIIINLAGIYFQFLINILLVAIFFTFNLSENNQLLLKTLFFTNCALCLYALNPFMRNDGYWVYSDFFRIPNLTDAAKKYPGLFVSDYILKKDKSVRKEGLLKLRKDIPLLIYSVFLYIIIALIYVGLIMFSYKNYESLKFLFVEESVFKKPFVFESFYHLTGLAFSITINIIFVYRVIKSFIVKGNKNYSII